MTELARTVPGTGAAPSAAVRFGVLGPVTIWRGSAAAPVTAAKHRSVLAVLLVHANRVVGVDTLVDELWTDSAPSTARKTVQGYVWRLRRAIGPASDALTTVDSGYQVRVCEDQLDLLAFERRVSSARTANEAGRPGVAVDSLTSALQLWRGPAFAGVPRTPLIDAQVQRLVETRLAAHELLADAKLALGRHREAVPELIELVAAYPCRESLHRLLMAALYRSGRQPDALAVFMGLQRRLAADYGVDPHHETKSLHRAILRGAVDIEPGR